METEVCLCYNLFFSMVSFQKYGFISKKAEAIDKHLKLCYNIIA